MLKNFDDLLELLLLKSLGQHNKVSSPSVPVGDLIKWAFNLLIGWRVLVRDKLLDLASPVDHSRLQSL